MKKISKILLSFILCLTSILILSACNAKIESASVKEGTLETTIEKNSTVDTSHIIVIVNYSDGKSVEVNTEDQDLKIGTISTSTVGTKKLKITYKDYSFYVDIEVTANNETLEEDNIDDVALMSLSSNLLTTFKNRKAEQQNKEEEFINRDNLLYVGDDNLFHFDIVATGIDSDGDLSDNITRFRSNITVKQWINDEYVELTGATLDRMVAIDNTRATFDFTENAVGERFELTVSAANIVDGYLEVNNRFTAEVKVVDAYNVYNTRDLAVYDNYHNSYNDIRSTNSAVNGIVLQRDIKVEKQDVRQDMFWTGAEDSFDVYNGYTDQKLAGTPYDDPEDGIYTRRYRDGDNFTFRGNYFSVDISDFPKCVVEWSRGNSDGDAASGGLDEHGEPTKDAKYMTSHLCVFYNKLADVNGNEITLTKKTGVTWEGIKFSGNGELNADPLNSGAIMLTKFAGVSAVVENTITNNFYMINMVEHAEHSNEFSDVYLLKNNKGFNSYQCLIYVYGAKQLNIVNCEYRNAGGPGMIVDHVDNDDKTGAGGFPSHVNIIGSIIESNVSGQEPWFGQYEATTIVQMLLQADAFYDGSQGLPETNKTIVSQTVKGNVQQMNLMVVMKSGSAQGLTASRVRGYVRAFKDMADYNKYYGIDLEEGEVADTTLTYGLDMERPGNIMDMAFKSGYVYFESNGNGGYINTGLQDGANLRISLYEGTIKANVLAGIIGMNQDFQTMTAPLLADFGEKSLVEQKAILETIITYIRDNLGNEEASKEVLMSIYNAGLIIGDKYGQSGVEDNYYPLSTINGAEDMTNSELADTILAQIEAYKNKDYYTGDYINIYIGMDMGDGMGAMIGFYPSNDD